MRVEDIYKLNLLNIAIPNTVFKHHAKLKYFRNVAT